MKKRFDNVEINQIFVYVGSTLKKVSNLIAKRLSDGQEFHLNGRDMVTVDVGVDAAEIPTNDPLYMDIYGKLVVLLATIQLTPTTIKLAIDKLLEGLKGYGKVTSYFSDVAKYVDPSNKENILITINFYDSNGALGVIRKTI